MKNLRLLLFFLTMSASLCGWCYDFEKGGIYYNILSEQDKTVEVTGYEEECSEYSIPAEVNGYAVISIGKEAFLYCDGLKSINIPSSVTTIGAHAFDGCENLTSIDIPNSVTTIGKGAFYECQNLTSVVIQNGITNIEEKVFYGCISLTSVAIPNGVTSIGEYAFYNCI